MSSTKGLKDSGDFCTQLVRTHDFARYASTLFAPVEQRRGLIAIYAFNVEISRVREQVSQPLPGEVRLQWWTDMLAGAGHGGGEGNPLAAELKLAIRNWRVAGGRPVAAVHPRSIGLHTPPMPPPSGLEGC